MIGAFKKLFLNDRFIMAVILLNSIVIFIQGFPMNEQNIYAGYLTYLDDIFSVVFIIELLIKTMHYGWKKYISSNWNKLDFFLIVVSIPPLILHMFPEISLEISFILVFRVFRVFKFIRFIKFFPDVEHIFRSVQIAMKASFTVFVGFIILIFITSILSCNLYHEISPQYFGDPITSLYSIFKIFTVEGWNAIPDEMCMEDSVGYTTAFFTKFFFSALMFFGGIYGLSIVNSIFVDAMVSDNNEEATHKIESIEKTVLEMNERMDELMKKIDNLKS